MSISSVQLSTPTTATLAAHGLRGALLRFAADGEPQWQSDALLVVDPDGRVALCDDFARGARVAAERWPGLPIADHRGRVLAPAFIDSHVHFPQLDIIGSPAADLLPWLSRYTFPAEARYADPLHAQAAAAFFLDELLRHGVTTAAAFATSHPASVTALFTAAEARGMCVLSGKVLQDRHSPDGLRDDTERSLRDSEDLLFTWHGRGRLRYALTPRFAPTSTPRQLAGAGELLRAYPDIWMQTHVAESLAEVAWVRELFPAARSYLDVYDQVGLLGRRSLFAHCLHLDAADRERLRATGALTVVCPTSNLFLGSGLFDFAAAQAAGQTLALASDVGGGTSLSPFATMLAAYQVGRLRGAALTPSALWFHHTRGAAQGLDLGHEVGDLRPGCYADVVLLDPQATPLLARRTARCDTLEEWLFSLITLADERAIAAVWVAGRRAAPPPHAIDDGRASPSFAAPG